MEEEHGNSSFSSTGNLETAKAERSVWLMKCPVAVAKSWQSHPHSDPHPVAKVVLSLDPLHPDESSSLKFTMEMTGTDGGKIPKSYSLNMFKDFVPMCVLSEANQGKVAMEGKVEHKFDMKPHGENLEEYGRLCRERTNKSMIKNRQIQVIDNDRGVHMRPMPGMIGLISSTSKDKKKTAPVKQSDMKRTRRDRGELEDIMFKLFEKQPNWALKQLVQETDQPTRNIGDTDAVAIAALSSQNPDVITIANAVFGSKPQIASDILVKAFQVNKDVVDYIKTKF